MAKKAKSRYELKEELGEGGMGVVWRAFDTVLNIDVALKMLLDASDATALKLFQEECNKQSALAHPNIVEIRDVGTFDEDGHHQPYLVMPLLRGTTLAAMIRSASQPLSVERCIDIVSQACRGLQAAHDFGLLHRDIKPSNLFILEDDSVKIIDFGVAHRLDVSRTMSRKGTLLYMSPEQLSMKPLTRASDVFSLAVVCYEALTRKQPFLAASEDDVVEAIRNVNPPPASSLNPLVSVSLSQVLCKAMAKDPRHRFATAKEFGDYLRRAFYDDSLTVFDPSKFRPRLEKAGEAYQQGNLEFAQELINELESEGYLTEELEYLAANIKTAAKNRTIEQLLESARARAQDGEYRLALQRVNEVLQLEPRQEDALVLQHDIEARRAEADIADWLRVGQQHLDKFSFSHARQAAQRILEMKPGEERALYFLQQVERKESGVQRIREHKKEAYAAALEAEKRNDLTSALSKMKEVLELEQQAPDSNESGQLASYQTLYNKLHSEHEAIAASYTEAKKALEHGDYASASQLCDKFLEQFPQHTLFKALKFDTEQRWRKAVSLRLIEVEEAAENEPDLDQRVRMLEEAVHDSPDVPEFNRLLQGAREKRDLVNGIVSRARTLEKRELYGEALVQWETLQTIYPNFPGLNFEIENVRLRRQLGERMARKSHWITEINRAIEECDFEDGQRLLSPALEEFPGDNEFIEMKAYIRRQQEMADEAERLIKQGRRSLDDGDTGRGLEKLRRAYEAGSKVKRAKQELVEGLLRAARSNQSDPPQARIHLQEILSLDPGNHAATGMLRFLDDQEEYQKVDTALSQARQLRTNSDIHGAITVLETASREYPRNARLKQMLREMDASRNELRIRDLEVVRRKRLEADTMMSLPSLNEQVASVEQIADRYKDDEEFQNESRMVRARLHTIAATVATPPQQIKLQKTGNAPRKETPVKKNIFAGRERWLYSAAAGIAAAILFVTGALLWTRTKSSQQQDAGPAATSTLTDVSIHSTPEGARILRDGKVLGVASPGLVLKLPAGKVQLEAQMDGYDPQSQTIDIASGHPQQLTFGMVPVRQQLRLVGDGSFSLDGTRAAPLTDGMFSGELSTGNHELRWMGKGGYNATFHLLVQDGKPAALVGPVSASPSGNALLVSTAAKHARVYTTATLPVKVDGVAHGFADSNGFDIDLPAGLHTIASGKEPNLLVGNVESGPERLLLISFENAPKLGSLTVLTNVDGVALKLMRGSIVVGQGTSTAGKLDIVDLPAGHYTLQASGTSSAQFDPQTIVLKKGENATVSLQAKNAPVQLALRVRTLPGANIFVDGTSVGSTGADGSLLVPALASGEHHIEARRKGKTAATDVNLAEGQANPYIADIKLDKGPAAVTLQLDPADSTVAITNAKGEQVSVSGQHFGLPEGKYHFTARSNGYADRDEVEDIAGDSAVTVNLKLTPIAVASDAPSINGWDSAEWSVDTKGHTLTHHSENIGFYSAQPGRGKYVFAGPIGHGFLIGKHKVEWVADYHDPANYLLFSMDRNELEMFTVSGGKKTTYGSKITFPQQSKYQIMVQIVPGHVITSFNNGQGWKQLNDWGGLPEDADAGRFGFKGPVTLTSFSYIR